MVGIGSVNDLTCDLCGRLDVKKGPRTGFGHFWRHASPLLWCRYLEWQELCRVGEDEKILKKITAPNKNHFTLCYDVT